MATMVSNVIPFLAKPWLVSGCQKYQANPTRKILFLELLAVNAPRILIVRSLDEALDTGFNEIGNTIGFFGGLYGGNVLLDKMLAKLKIPIENNTSTTISRGRFMKSWALLWPLAAFMFAMPFFRNAYTTWRSGATDFEKLISNKAQFTKPQANTSTHQQKKIHENLTRGALSLAGGFAIAAGGFLLAKGLGPLRMFKGKQLVPALNKPLIRTLLDKLCLVDVGKRKAGFFDDLHAVLFWGTPAYLAWIAAAREALERKEQILKTMSFYAVYAFADKVVYRLFNKRSEFFSKYLPQLYQRGKNKAQFSYLAYQRLIKNPQGSSLQKHWARFAVAHENKRLMSGFGMTLVLMASLPILINMALTEKRLHDKKRKQLLAHIESQQLVLPRPNSRVENWTIRQYANTSWPQVTYAKP